jgi:hypothetical protein
MVLCNSFGNIALTILISRDKTLGTPLSMPLSHLLYRCPFCGQDPMDGHGDRAWCDHCASEFRRGGEGGRLWVRRGQGFPSQRPARDLVRAMESSGSGTPATGPEVGRRPDGSRAGEDSDPALIQRRAAVRTRRSTVEAPIRARGETLGFYECLGEEEEGLLELSGDRLLLRAWSKEKPEGTRREAPVSWQCKLLVPFRPARAPYRLRPGAGGSFFSSFLRTPPDAGKSFFSVR